AINNDRVLVERPPKHKKRKPNTTGNASEGEATSDHAAGCSVEQTPGPEPSSLPMTIVNPLHHVAITPAPMFPSISATTGPCPTANAAVPASARADTRKPRPSMRPVKTEPPTPSGAPAPSTDSRPQIAPLSSPTLDSSASLTDTTRSAIGKGKTSTRIQAADCPFELRKEMKLTARNFAINEWLTVPGNKGRVQKIRNGHEKLKDRSQALGVWTAVGTEIE
ncbi:hypothetical protein BC826DRAFT_976222, partial [Russula brevipes]